MDTSQVLVIPQRLKPLAQAAALLQRLELQSLQVSAHQYQQVVQEVTSLLQNETMDPALDKLLSAFPAAAEIYENLRYEQAGLCRSPQELALNAELSTLAAVKAIRQTPDRSR